MRLITINGRFACLFWESPRTKDSAALFERDANIWAISKATGGNTNNEDNSTSHGADQRVGAWVGQESVGECLIFSVCKESHVIGLLRRLHTTLNGTGGNTAKHCC